MSNHPMAGPQNAPAPMPPPAPKSLITTLETSIRSNNEALDEIRKRLGSKCDELLGDAVTQPQCFDTVDPAIYGSIGSLQTVIDQQTERLNLVRELVERLETL